MTSSARKVTIKLTPCKNSNAEKGTKVCQFNWHIPALAISNAKMLIYFSNEICDNKFIKQHQETAMVLNYQNADCSLRKKILLCHLLQLSAQFRSL